MDGLIGPYQTGFVKDRSILGAISKEIIHQCECTDRKGYLMKLDFEKAYYNVSWDCLLMVLKS